MTASAPVPEAPAASAQRAGLPVSNMFFAISPTASVQPPDLTVGAAEPVEPTSTEMPAPAPAPEAQAVAEQISGSSEPESASRQGTLAPDVESQTADGDSESISTGLRV